MRHFLFCGSIFLNLCEGATIQRDANVVDSHPIEVLFIRHSQSTWNRNKANKSKFKRPNLKVFYGDAPLTKDGIREAAELALWINGNDKFCQKGNYNCLMNDLKGFL